MGSSAGADQVLVTGPLIADSLPLGPDPNGPKKGPSTDPGSLLAFTEFDSAIAARHGVSKIPLTAAQLKTGFIRITVFGLRSRTCTGGRRSRASAICFQAHHYTDGLELLPLQLAHQQYRHHSLQHSLPMPSPNYAKLYAVEQGPDLCPLAPHRRWRPPRACAWHRSQVLLAHVSGADGGQDEVGATALNTVMSWPATWGYFLEQIVTGAVPDPDTILPLVRDHFISHVRGRGNFPILRVGEPALWCSSHDIVQRLGPCRRPCPRCAADEGSTAEDDDDLGRLSQLSRRFLFHCNRSRGRLL